MAVQIENLGSLDRKMTLEFARADLAKAREARLAKVGKTMKMAGFRPGKVPKNLVEKQHGMQIDFELQFDKAAEMFYEQAKKDGVALAGQPRLEPKSELDADKIVFDAFFEVLPEVKIGDFSKAEVTKYTTEIGEAEIIKSTFFASRFCVIHFAIGGVGGSTCCAMCCHTAAIRSCCPITMPNSLL